MASDGAWRSLTEPDAGANILGASCEQRRSQLFGARADAWRWPAEKIQQGQRVGGTVNTRNWYWWTLPEASSCSLQRRMTGGCRTLRPRAARFVGCSASVHRTSPYFTPAMAATCSAKAWLFTGSQHLQLPPAQGAGVPGTPGLAASWEMPTSKQCAGEPDGWLWRPYDHLTYASSII